MLTVLIALGSFVLYIVAYRTYGRFLARKVFQVDPGRLSPSEELCDGVDFVPSRKELVFGHHFTSIAGTGPIVGPAVAVVWGWVPALIWVLVGSIVMGAVHDFGSLVISMRHKGRTIADVAGDVVNPRVRLLFLLVVVMGLWIVLAVFGLVIAAVFSIFPSSVAPVFLQIPIAVGLGIWMKRGSLLLGTIVAVVLMYGSIAVSANYGWAQVGLPAAITNHISAVGFWTLILLVYVFVASVLPVQWLLQPRDYINSWQLLIAMGLLLVGLVVAHPPIVADAVNFTPQPAGEGAWAPPFLPFLFVTIACGAISGFHCLVSSGCSSRQLRSEGDAQYVGYGAMLTEGFLATLVILACCAGIGLGTTWRGFEPIAVLQAHEGASIEAVDHNTVEIIEYGKGAWQHHYGVWGGDKGLGANLAPFVEGSANVMTAIGLSKALATAIMGVFVASFAATTMDSACRLQRYVIAELFAGRRDEKCELECGGCGYSRRGLRDDVVCPECGNSRVGARVVGWRRLLVSRYGATSIAVLTAGILALSDAVIVDRYYQGVFFTTSYGGSYVVTQLPGGGKLSYPEVQEMLRYNEELWPGIDSAFDLPPLKTSLRLNLAQAGKGGLILWPVFGATNQLLGGLALLVLTVWLVRTRRPRWVTALPMMFMLAMTGWAIVELIRHFAPPQPNWLLLGVSVAMLAMEVWIVVEAARLMFRYEPLVEGARARVAGE
ncbi:MAG: carbon starvation protein A [Phycisphaerales bacterium]